MLQNAVDDARICNKRYDAHASAARAQQRVRLENSLNQAAHALRVSWAASELSELSHSGSAAAGIWALSPTAGARRILPRLEHAP